MGLHDPLVIVGAGVFGLSTALELRKRSYTNVTVLDRFMPPVPDGSSVDISRIIRMDYSDPLYGRLAREAHALWKSAYKDHFHESGFVMYGDRQSGSPYLEKVKAVNAAIGNHVDVFDDANDIRGLYPNIQANLDGLSAVHNPKSGWADAAGAIRQLASQCSNAGVSFITGARGTVLSLVREDSRVVGVKVAAGSPIMAAQVILATGAWTNVLLPLEYAMTASGQQVGFIQLTDEEAKRLRGTPVMISMTTGLFVFPPSPNDNLLKVARHGYGFATDVNLENPSRRVSSPKLMTSNAASGYLPDDADESLREGLRQLIPEFASHPWSGRRLCWYSDTPDGDFIVDKHPHLDGLFMATGGAGHAFKFLPVLGRHIVDCFEDKASPELKEKWSLVKHVGNSDILKKGDGSRRGPALRKLSKTEQAKL